MTTTYKDNAHKVLTSDDLTLKTSVAVEPRPSTTVCAIDYRKSIMTDMEESKRNEQTSDFLADIDYALDTMKYMHDMQIGKAAIRPIVEEVRQFLL
ncbi:hypothetical protein ANCDUO_12710 [Ancylostoma duodenale]|uniref:Uncharacterized protein n=1 Tax=Ancylostoma duodenale TaxID=51022 RepID=A0A0C2GJ33_9BILA|nr:hypothetical protein ANCDUO_12710 [Ancylostoma duodenale]